MLACCKLCGLQYVNDDGTIDPEALKQAQTHYNEYAEKNNRPKLNYSQFTPCKCSCHTKGSDTLH